MVIDLRKCVERSLNVEDRFDLSADFSGYPEVEAITPVEAAFSVAAAGTGRFLVSGSFATQLRAFCVRCLESFPVGISGQFRLLYLEESVRPKLPEGDGEMPAGEVDVSYYREDQLEVLPLLKEQVHLAFPMRFLCRESCRGLCQHCGANQNETSCSCRVGEVNPGLEGLRSLLE